MVQKIDEMVQETFPFEEYKGVDLAQFSKELRSLLDLEMSDEEFLTQVSVTVATLRDGHTRVEFRQLETPGIAPVDIQPVNGSFRIISVDDLDLEHLIGKKVVAIDDEPPAQRWQQRAGQVVTGRFGEAPLQGSAAFLSGEADQNLRLLLEGGTVVELRRRRFHSAPSAERFGDIGYLRIHTFGFIDDLETIDGFINDLMDTRGLIIDLRGNGGGYPSVTDGIFGRLIDSEVEPFRLEDRNGTLHRELRARSRGETYEGEVVILTDSRTYSASNYLAHRMVHHDRGVLLGAKTGGGAASPQRGAVILPGIWFQVSTHVLYPPSGSHSESGIEPTIPYSSSEELPPGESSAVLSTLESLPDSVIQRAIRYLEEGQ